MLGADERAYFVRKWNQVISPQCNCNFLLNAIAKMHRNVVLALLASCCTTLRPVPVVTTALSCINASSRMSQGVDAVFQPIVGALIWRGL